MSSRRRRLFLESAKRFAALYAKSRIGVIGLAIILFFSGLAVFAPIITTNNPVTDYNVASPYAVPVWATAIPRYQNLPPTLDLLSSGTFSQPADVGAWQISTAKGAVQLAQEGDEYPPGQARSGGSLLVNESFAPVASPPQSQLPGQLVFSMSQSFDYPYKPPYTFILSAYLKPVSLADVSAIYANFVISTPEKNYSIGTLQSYTIRTQISFPKNRVGTWGNITIGSGLLPSSGIPDFTKGQPGAIMFGHPGTYRFSFQIFAQPEGQNPRVSFYVTDLRLHLLGRSYGLLGTDSGGRDVWSQFVWGSQVSLLVGILSAVFSVLLGTVVGLAAGLWGGRLDQLLMRITDFFLVIPFLPLVIVVVFIIGQNPLLYKSIYLWVILLFAVISWPSIARIIRSQVLTVKERQFVEASRAVGGDQSHIMVRHILPNVTGLVYSQTALLVPTFILTEAALDFIAISIHPVTTITWGIMLTQGFNDALTNVTVDYVWWWFLPPGIAIALLSLAFVLVGFALDSIFNPKLRRR